MMVRIEKTVDKSSDLLVTFECELGRGLATWRGKSAPSNVEQDVEIEVDNEGLAWGISVFPTTSPDQISIINGSNSMSVHLLEALEGNLFACKFGDANIFLEIDDLTEFPKMISIENVNLSLFPTNT